MAFLDVYENPHPKSRLAIPFLVDLQADLLASLATRFVVPLYRADATKVAPIARLTPTVTFQGQALIAMVPEATGLLAPKLGVPVGRIPGARGDLVAALDLLVTGT